MEEQLTGALEEHQPVACQQGRVRPAPPLGPPAPGELASSHHSSSPRGAMCDKILPAHLEISQRAQEFFRSILIKGLCHFIPSTNRLPQHGWTWTALC